MNRYPFELSEVTKSLVRYLSARKKGDEVSYKELSTVAGILIDSRSGHLISARRILERDHNAVWICVQPGIAVRRLDDIELARRLKSHWLRGARRKLDRGGQQADIVETRRLDLNQQSSFAVDCIQRSLAMDALSRTTRKRMEKVARGTSNDLPSFNIIEWAITLSPRGKGHP